MAHGFPARLFALLALACTLVSALRVGPAGAAPGDALRPFPQHQAYTPGSIRPSLVSQAGQDAAVAAIYAQWKAGFLRPGCAPGRYYVWHGGRGGAGPGTVGTSEGQGYGMLIAAYMAGLDPDAHAIFDGLYAHFRDHPSLTSPDLMAWRQLDGCVDSPDAYSATDGDLDIAYALLLADRQWGSGGAINYLAEAGRVAAELVVVDSALRPGVEPEGWQERELNDGSRHRVFKRYLSPEQLRAELGAEILHAGRWFIVGRSRLD
jgi:hypothetical protein